MVGVLTPQIARGCRPPTISCRALEDWDQKLRAALGSPPTLVALALRLCVDHHLTSIPTESLDAHNHRCYVFGRLVASLVASVVPRAGAIRSSVATTTVTPKNILPLHSVSCAMQGHTIVVSTSSRTRTPIPLESRLVRAQGAREWRSLALLKLHKSNLSH